MGAYGVALCRVMLRCLSLVTLDCVVLNCVMLNCIVFCCCVRVRYVALVSRCLVLLYVKCLFLPRRVKSGFLQIVGRGSLP